MTEKEIAEEYVDTLLNKDDTELDKFLDENLVGLKLNEKQAGTILGVIKGVGICSFLAGLKAQTKWHKVADEGLPINKNDGATYLLYTIYGEGGSPVVAHFAYRDKQELMNVWTGAILTEDKIVAWKEIVLPEEVKEKC